MNFQLQHQACNGYRYRLAYATGMTEQDVLLQSNELISVYAGVSQHTETGVDTVMGIAILQGLQHNFPGFINSGMRLPQCGHAVGQVLVKTGNPDRMIG